MHQVTLIGHFGKKGIHVDGQTVKTRMIFDVLCSHLGEQQVRVVDTQGRFKAVILAAFWALKAFCSSKHIIMMPAHNGLKLLGPILSSLKKFFKQRGLHYVVIGGWLPEVLRQKKHLLKALKRFDGIYVETQTASRALMDLGLDSVYILPNFKALNPISEQELHHTLKPPYRFCIFSRVMPQKGIAVAVKAIQALNQTAKEPLYELDIYGPVDPNHTAWFSDLKQSFTDEIHYKGVAPYDQTVAILSHYDGLLFPTQFATEGIPGTILDAYASGLPVISARWESFSDLIIEGETGWGYALGDEAGLMNCLKRLVASPQEWQAMKANCLAASKNYQPDKAVEKLMAKIK